MAEAADAGLCRLLVEQTSLPSLPMATTDIIPTLRNIVKISVKVCEYTPPNDKEMTLGIAPLNKIQCKPAIISNQKR